MLRKTEATERTVLDNFLGANPAAEHCRDKAKASQYFSKVFSLIFAIPNWQQDRQLVNQFVCMRDIKRHLLWGQSIEEDEIVLLDKTFFIPTIPRPDYTGMSEEQSKGVEQAYHFIAYQGRHKNCENMYHKIFEKITSIPNWRKDKQLYGLFLALRHQKCKCFGLMHSEEDAEFFIDSTLGVRERLSVLHLSERLMDTLELGYNFLAAWGPHRTYGKAFDKLYKQIALCPGWRKQEQLMSLYRALKSDQRNNTVFTETEMKDKQKKPDFSGLSEAERKVAEDAYRRIVEWTPSQRYEIGYNNLFKQMHSLKNWKEKTVLVQLYKLLRNQKRLVIEVHHIEEDVVVLPQGEKPFSEVPTPDCTGMSEREKEAVEHAFGFLVYDGPHRTYQKAYQKVFEEITSVPNWRQNGQLVGLYQALRDEKRMYSFPQRRCLGSKEVEEDAEMLTDYYSLLKDKTPDFQKLFSRRREIEAISNEILDAQADQALESREDYERIIDRITSVARWQQSSALKSHFDHLNGEIKSKFQDSKPSQNSSFAFLMKNILARVFSKQPSSKQVQDIERRDPEDIPLKHLSESLSRSRDSDKPAKSKRQ